MMRLRAALLASALVAAAPVAAAAQASSTIERIEEDFSQEVQNPCNGETVQITGTLLVTFRTTVDANGVTHFDYNLVPHVRGEGPTGAYKVVGGDRLHENFTDGGPGSDNYSSTSEFNIVSQGKAPNFVSTFSAKYLTAPDGTVKVDMVHTGNRCTANAPPIA